jgi:hypothetical protein
MQSDNVIFHSSLLPPCCFTLTATDRMLLARSLFTITVLLVTVLHSSASSNTTATSYLSHPTKDHNKEDAASIMVIELTADNRTDIQLIAHNAHEEREANDTEILKLRRRAQSNNIHQGSRKLAGKTATKVRKSPKSGKESSKQPKLSGKKDKKKFKVLAGQYLIRLDDDMRPEVVESAANELLTNIKALVQRTQPNLQVQIGHIYMNSIKGFSISNFPDQLASLLLTLPGVIKIEQDYEAYLDLPNVPQDNSTSTTTQFKSTNLVDRNLQGCIQEIPWGVTRVGGPIYRGSTNKVFIIDTGIAPFSSELNIDTSRSRDFTNFGSWKDDHGHGTHVAGTIAGKCRVLGVVPGATVVAVKVFRLINGRPVTVGNSILAGLDYAGSVAVAGDVINLSLGGAVDSVFDNAVINLAKKGIKFAIAAGNESKNAALISPARANHANVYTVSAMDIYGRLASFSNYGSPPIDYAAPGQDVVSLIHTAAGAVRSLSGTSMAAPHVAGLLVIGDVTSLGLISGDKDTTPDPIAYKKETAWYCVRNGFIVDSVTIWWGHTTSDGCWACNAWRSSCNKSCSAVPR